MRENPPGLASKNLRIYSGRLTDPITLHGFGIVEFQHLRCHLETAVILGLHVMLNSFKGVSLLFAVHALERAKDDIVKIPDQFLGLDSKILGVRDAEAMAGLHMAQVLVEG